MDGKDFAAPSVFEPENLLREARRQKNLPGSAVPEICLLDPDGDIVRALARSGQSRRSASWACYHTDLYEFDHGDEHFGIIGCAVDPRPISSASTAPCPTRARVPPTFHRPSSPRPPGSWWKPP